MKCIYDHFAQMFSDLAITTFPCDSVISKNWNRTWDKVIIGQTIISFTKIRCTWPQSLDILPENMSHFCSSSSCHLSSPPLLYLQPPTLRRRCVSVSQCPPGHFLCDSPCSAAAAAALSLSRTEASLQLTAACSVHLQLDGFGWLRRIS